MTNFHQEPLPCGCLPGYRRCDRAEKLRTQIDTIWRQNKHKSKHDPVWQEYNRLNDEYLQHIRLEVRA